MTTQPSKKGNDGPERGARESETVWHLEAYSEGGWHRPFPPMRDLKDAHQDLRTFRELNPDISYRLVEEQWNRQVIA